MVKGFRNMMLTSSCIVYKKEMGSSLSVFANIVQILGFVLQLVQAGPDLMSRIPGVVRGARAWLRGMTSRLGIIV
jgi:hypothetical protein